MTPPELSRGQRVQKFCIKNVLPLGFFVALVIALVWPAPGKAFAKPKVEGFRVVQTINVVIIFIISGLKLKTDDIKEALSKEGRLGYIYGIVAILGITGCIGFVAAEIPFDVKEFSYGLAVFCVVPTTLSSGVTLVMNAGGNDALALLLTVTTNLLGVVTVPFFVKGVIKAGDDASINAVDLLVKLIITVLIPLVVGKMIREIAPGAKAWTKKHRVPLGLTSSAMLIMVVWQTLSRAQSDLTSVEFTQILSVIAAGIALHFVYLCINYPVCRYVLKLKRREFKAVVLMSSQKTLPVSVVVIGFLDAIGEEGLMTVPCIVAHISQLFIDAYIASKWAEDEVEASPAVEDGVKMNERNAVV
ncbi:unnamed protein product [Hapterophycus canaliculatus]